MNKTFFISDTHWGHANVIRFHSRPFKDVDEMNKEMVKRWNAKVSPDDIVWHLGDFALSPTNYVKFLLHNLNGKLHLCKGNHEKSLIKPAHCRNMLHELVDYKELNIDGQKVCLMHYPIESWNKKNHGSIHLHGHVHSKGERFKNTNMIPNRYNVNCEFWNYEPVTLEEIICQKKTLKIE